jgi:hypothetical protein
MNPNPILYLFNQKSFFENEKFTHALLIENVNHKFSEPIKKQPFQFIFDLTHFTTLEKSQFYQHLTTTFQTPIIGEMSCVRGEEIMQMHPAVQGAFNFFFTAPKGTGEYWAQNSCAEKAILDFYRHFLKSGTKVTGPGWGFIFPRIIATIVNEAYFALEAKIADASGIDDALKFGVNYPRGPFEWAEMIGLDHIEILLNELSQSQQNTGHSKIVHDQRYQPCSLISSKTRI